MLQITGNSGNIEKSPTALSCLQCSYIRIKLLVACSKKLDSKLKRLGCLRLLSLFRLKLSVFEHLLSIEYHQATIFLPFPKSSRRPTTKLSLFASRLRLSKAFFSLETSFDPKNWQRTLKSKGIENKVSFLWDVEKPFLYIEYRILSKRSILQDHPDKNVVSNFCRSLCPQK